MSDSIDEPRTGQTASRRPSQGVPGARAWARRIARALGARGDEGTDAQGDDPAAWLDRHAKPISPLAKRRILPGIPTAYPAAGHYGWAQLGASGGAGFSIGVFAQPNRFFQVGFADAQGRVYVTPDPSPNTTHMEPAIVFEKERDQNVPVSWIDGNPDGGGPAPTLPAVVGGVYLRRRDTGERVRMATWIKHRNAYTITDTRTRIPDEDRCKVSYRDALAVAFLEFAVFLEEKRPLPYGSANIVAHLASEAPLAAIRASVDDIRATRRLNRRVSGLEEYFVDLMRETGALSPIHGLEAEHGAEPLHIRLFESGHLNLAWDGALEANAGMAALRIEGALNRFLAVFRMLLLNEEQGVSPIEGTLRKEQVAQIDMDLLENPALGALRAQPGAQGDPRAGLLRTARATGASLRDAERASRGADAGDAPSEWCYRRALSILFDRLSLPFRMNLGFRSNLAAGAVAVRYTSASPTMMPRRRYDAASGSWVALSERDREAMAADYGLRVGMVLAAVAFGADERVSEVSVRMDSLGLDEMRRQNSSALGSLIESLMARYMDGGLPGEGSGAGGEAAPLEAGAPGGEGGEGAAEDAGGTGEGGENSENAEDGDGLRFASDPAAPGLDSLLSLPLHHAAPAAPDGTVSLIPLSTVTFTRRRFLDLFREYGLGDPVGFHRAFGAQIDQAPDGRLRMIDPSFDVHDPRFFPTGSQEVPEVSDMAFTPGQARVLGCDAAAGLAIQREDLLQRAIGDFHRLAAADADASTVDRARRAMGIVASLGDPELQGLSDQVTGALIDGRPIPDLPLHADRDLEADAEDALRLMSEDGMMEGIHDLVDAVERGDALFAHSGGRPVYFDSYAERIVYNRMFSDGRPVTLIPDSLYRIHVIEASVIDFHNVHAPEDVERMDPLPNLRRMVAYTPSSPLPREMLAMKLMERQQWTQARRVAVEALERSITRQAAGYAYAQIAFCEWMLDHFDVAAACDVLSLTANPTLEPPAPGIMPAVDVTGHLRRMIAVASSQNVDVPRSTGEARKVAARAGIPAWPSPLMRDVLHDAERVCTDAGLFVPAQSVARACLNMDEGDGLSADEAMFIHSLDS